MRFEHVRRLGGQPNPRPNKDIWQVHIFMHLDPDTKLKVGQKTTQTVVVKNFNRHRTFDVVVQSVCTGPHLKYPGSATDWKPDRARVDPTAALDPAAKVTLELPQTIAPAALPTVEQIKVRVTLEPLAPVGIADTVRKTHTIQVYA